jgi:hypothetical protein
MNKKLVYLISFILIIGIALTSPADAANVGLWKLDDGSGTIAVDSSENANDGTLEGDPQWITGQLGGALEFDGNGDYVDLPITQLMGSLTNTSFTIWANFSGAGGAWQRIMDIGTGPTFNMFITPNNGATSTLRFAITVSGYADEDQTTAPDALPDGWNHVAVTMNAVNNTHILYINGEQVAQNTSARYFPTDLGTTTQNWLARSEYSADPYYNGALDDFHIYDHVLTQEEVLTIMTAGKLATEIASGPNPQDEAVDVDREVVLSWSSGTTAQTHDVYLGTVFDDVDNADRDNPMGVLVSQDNATNSFAPATRLDLDQTYYWRIDEVEAGGTIYKGDVWSFTAELLAYPITAESITVAASSFEEDKEPENVINGSGLDESGLLHSNEGEGNMWLSNRDGEQPTWIAFEFDKVYKLHQMLVWNSNESLEPIVGLGFKDVTIEYSVDGTDYITLGTTHEFAQAPGGDDYAHNTTIDFGDIAVKSVRLTANSNWGGILNQYGLSEVRFLQIPVHAQMPDPASRDTGVALDVTLEWKAGREAAEHNVYFSQDEQAVMDGTASVTTVTDASFGPLALDLGETYFWRVDEVNNAETPAIWQGAVWEFRSQDYIVVDDFEDYNDYAPDRIFDVWLDGYGTATNGSTVGYPNPDFGEDEHFVETAIVHSGSQAMPYFYDNAAGSSEATLPLSSQRNWTEKGIGNLSLWFRGNPEGLVEDPSGTLTVSASGTDIWETIDEFRFVYKQLSGPGSITARVESVEGTDESAKAGVMIRQSLDPSAKFAAVYITPGNGCTYQARLTAAIDAISDDSVATAEQTAITAPYWVRIERDASDNFNGYYSSDGVNWVSMAWNPQNTGMPLNVFIGLAVTSHNATETCTAVFSNIETTGTVSPQIWTQQAIGVDMYSNNPERMYVVLNDSALVYNDDPDASQIDLWTEWNIPLQTFADLGVDLTDVESLGIGFGDRSNPQPGGGMGLVYFDDIRLYPAPDEAVDPGTDNLVHSWTFEDGTANDSVGEAHGTLVGGAAIVDGAMVTTAQDQWMEMPGDVIAINTFDEVTVEAWYTPTAGANTSWTMLAYFGDSVGGLGANGFFITSARGDDKSRAAISVGNTTAPYNSESGADGPEYDDGRLHHMVSTINDEEITLYIDGVLQARTLLSPDNRIAGLSNNLAYLAKGGYTADPEWIGAIHEFNIYNRALTEGEVRFLAGN